MTNKDRELLQSMAIRLIGSDFDLTEVSYRVWKSGGVDSVAINARDLCVAYEGGDQCDWDGIAFALAFIIIVEGTPSSVSSHEARDGWSCLSFAFSLLLLADTISKGASDITEMSKFVVNGIVIRHDSFDQYEVAYLMNRVFASATL